jgi:L-threonylcarbamoyladenylate synthase
METKRFGWSEAQIRVAAELIRAGETVAFPTETVYGLGANAFDRNAVDQIFQAKGRPGDNPLIVHIARREDVNQLVTHIPEIAKRCMDRFWPGPLTLILPAKESIPSNVTAGLDTVGVRMPDHMVAIRLIEAAGVPLAAPSANRSGRPSPTTAEHVLEDLGGRIAGVVDGGPAQVGLESTVLDCTGEVPMILRPGSVTPEMLQEVLGDVRIDPALAGQGTPKSPGVKYTHYAPKGEMYLVEGAQARQHIRDLARKQSASGRRVGILTTSDGADFYSDLPDVTLLAVGHRGNLSAVAAGLYDAIRAFDHAGADVIYAETFPEHGTGLAIMNRLRKAAGQRVIQTD